jgi:uncharacterized protein
MLKRDFRLRLKALDAAKPGAFEGLLAVYNTVDLGGDVIVAGAFTKTIQDHGSQIPLLWQHRTDEPIGTLTLEDTPQALKVQGQLLLDLPTAQQAYTLLKNKIISGLSIGYDCISDSVENGVRVLKQLRLWEGSLVTFPMNQGAVVQSVKTFADAENLYRTADLSDPDVQKHIRSLNTLLKQLLRKDANCECPCDHCIGDDCEDCNNALCFDPNCEGHTDEERQQAQQLSDLMQLALQLRGLVAA